MFAFLQRATTFSSSSLKSFQVCVRCACVRACVRACVCVRMRTCMRACACVGASVRERVRINANMSYSHWILSYYPCYIELHTHIHIRARMHTHTHTHTHTQQVRRTQHRPTADIQRRPPHSFFLMYFGVGSCSPPVGNRTVGIST